MVFLLSGTLPAINLRKHFLAKISTPYTQTFAFYCSFKEQFFQKIAKVFYYGAFSAEFMIFNECSNPMDP